MGNMPLEGAEGLDRERAMSVVEGNIQLGGGGDAER